MKGNINKKLSWLIKETGVDRDVLCKFLEIDSKFLDELTFGEDDLSIDIVVLEKLGDLFCCSIWDLAKPHRDMKPAIYLKNKFKGKQDLWSFYCSHKLIKNFIEIVDKTSNIKRN